MLIYKLLAITVRSDNGSYMLSAITHRSYNGVKALHNNAKTYRGVIAIMLKVPTSVNSTFPES